MRTRAHYAWGAAIAWMLCWGAASSVAESAPAAPRPLEEVPASSAPATVGASILFSESEAESLKKSLQVYDARASGATVETAVKEEDDFLSELLSAPAAEKKKDAFPYFFLGSILYASPQEWAVFVNGRKLTPQDLKKTRALSVARISRSEAEFAWQPLSMPELTAAWERRKSLPTKTLPPIRLDDAAGTVYFTLKPNQTFFSRAMDIVEGKLPPRLPAMPLSFASPEPQAKEEPLEDDEDAALEEESLDAEVTAPPPSTGGTTLKSLSDLPAAP